MYPQMFRFWLEKKEKDAVTGMPAGKHGIAAGRTASSKLAVDAGLPTTPPTVTEEERGVVGITVSPPSREQTTAKAMTINKAAPGLLSASGTGVLEPEAGESSGGHIMLNLPQTVQSQLNIAGGFHLVVQDDGAVSLLAPNGQQTVVDLQQRTSSDVMMVVKDTNSGLGLATVGPVSFKGTVKQAEGDMKTIFHRAVSSVKEAQASRKRVSSASAAASSSSSPTDVTGAADAGHGTAAAAAAGTRRGVKGKAAKDSKTCKCGSTTHKRTSHKDCPLRKGGMKGSGTNITNAAADAGPARSKSNVAGATASAPETEPAPALASEGEPALSVPTVNLLATSAVSAASDDALLLKKKPAKKNNKNNKNKDSTVGSAKSRLQEKLKKNATGRGRSKRKLSVSEFFAAERVKKLEKESHEMAISGGDRGRNSAAHATRTPASTASSSVAANGTACDDDGTSAAAATPGSSDPSSGKSSTKSSKRQKSAFLSSSSSMHSPSPDVDHMDDLTPELASTPVFALRGAKRARGVSSAQRLLKSVTAPATMPAIDAKSSGRSPAGNATESTTPTATSIPPALPRSTSTPAAGSITEGDSSTSAATVEAAVVDVGGGGKDDLMTIQQHETNVGKGNGNGNGKGKGPRATDSASAISTDTSQLSFLRPVVQSCTDTNDAILDHTLSAATARSTNIQLIRKAVQNIDSSTATVFPAPTVSSLATAAVPKVVSAAAVAAAKAKEDARKRVEMDKANVDATAKAAAAAADRKAAAASAAAKLDAKSDASIALVAASSAAVSSAAATTLQPYSHATHAGLRFEAKLRRQLNAAVQVIIDELEHLYAQHAAAIETGDQELAAMFKAEAARVHAISSDRYAWLVSECNMLL